MDALMDFAFIDVTSDSDTTPAASTAPVAIATHYAQNLPSTCSSASTTTATQHEDMASSHAKLVEDLAQVVELSLEKFENRIAARVANSALQPAQNSTESSNLQHRPVAVSEPLSGPVHENVYCDHCNSVIIGIRFKCGMCKDYDLCECCESQRPHNQRNHLFIKIYEPLSGPFNARPLLSQEIGTGNPFASFLGSLGLPAGTEATLEVVRKDNSEVEIRELAQANGCQFYLSNNGQRLCKDYQAINRSNRDLPAGEYRLEHVFSTGLHPLEAKIPLPDIPEGDVRIICISWQAPRHCSSLLLGAGLSEASNDEDGGSAAMQLATAARPLRQATSVYRLKNRQGRHIGEPINASVALLQLASLPQQPPPPTPLPPSLSTTSTAASVQTDCIDNKDGDDDDDSFELISDAEYELPSCFVLDNVPCVSHQLFMPLISAETSAAAAAAAAAAASASSATNVNEAEATLIDVTPQPPRLVANAADNATAVTEVSAETTTVVSSTTGAATDSTILQPTAIVAMKPDNFASSSSTVSSNTVTAYASASTSSTNSSAAQSVARMLSQSQSDQVHPSALLAASYVPKTRAWLPPPPPPPRWLFKQQQQQQQQQLPPPPPPPIRFDAQQQQQQQQQQSFAVSQSISNSNSSSDIWGPRGAESQRLQLQKLLEMGFYRKDVNERVMRECDWDFDAALNRLSSIYEEF